jgi:ferritin-like metal-binding protein YciE
MAGILSEANAVMKENDTHETLDAAIIMAAQKVEHYEMAGYGSAACWADMLGRNDIKELLGRTLEEEETTDKKLNELAKSGINQRAAQRRSEEEFAA